MFFFCLQLPSRAAADAAGPPSGEHRRGAVGGGGGIPDPGHHSRHAAVVDRHHRHLGEAFAFLEVCKGGVYSLLCMAVVV